MIYETDLTREQEAKILMRLGRHFRGPVLQYPRLCELDGIIHLPAEVEIKGRTHTYGTFPDVWLEESKYSALTTDGLGQGMFVVQWNDRLGWCWAQKAVRGLTPEMVLRKDRPGEEPDPAYKVPIDRFKFIPEEET